jgi:hypothetical protein
MKTTRFLLAAGIALAMAFTFSCSSDDDSNNTGGDFDENSPSQAYNSDGSKFEASGLLECRLCYDKFCNYEEYITAGNVTNGIVKLELPSTLEPKYSIDVTEMFEEIDGCTVSQRDTETIFCGDFRLSGSDSSLSIWREDAIIEQGIGFLYSSKPTKITCNEEYRGIYNYDYKVNIDAKTGWNKIYVVKNYNNFLIEERSTDNILTKEVRWFVSLIGHNEPLHVF